MREFYDYCHFLVFSFGSCVCVLDFSLPNRLSVLLTLERLV